MGICISACKGTDQQVIQSQHKKISKSPSLNVGLRLKTSNNQNPLKPQIYNMHKFGIDIKSLKPINTDLKFIFRIYNFKCKMLIMNAMYVLRIIFDKKECPLTYSSGPNPKFIFDETLGKEINFLNMEKSFMEIHIYFHEEGLSKQKLAQMTKEDILGECKEYAFIKIDLLTLVLAPEKHDLALMDLRNGKTQIGRISYNVVSKHIDDVVFTVDRAKIKLNCLVTNDLALNLKYENCELDKVRETEFTHKFKGKVNNNDKTMDYEYISFDNLANKNKDNIEKLLHENKNILRTSAIREQELNRESTKNIQHFNTNYMDINCNGSINNYLKESTSFDIKNKLCIKGRMSLYDLTKSVITLNIYSIRYVEENSEKDLFMSKKSKSNFTNYMKYKTMSIVAFNNSKSKGKDYVKLVTDYCFLGNACLNFYEILNECQTKLNKEASKLFTSMSETKENNILIGRNVENESFSFALEENDEDFLGYKKDFENKIYKECKGSSIFTDKFKIEILEDFHRSFTQNLYDKGTKIGNVEMSISILRVPLIRQLMVGVMTEAGFEINSIFLYDNANLDDDLPAEILELTQLKKSFEEEITLNSNTQGFNKNFERIMAKIKECLSKSIEDSFLYYGYSNNTDLYIGQAIMLELGSLILELIDKLNMSQRKLGFEILKLLFDRSEFELGTLSVRWFKTIKKTRKSKHAVNVEEGKNSQKPNQIFNSIYNYDYEFSDKYLIDNKIIENFLHLTFETLNFALEILAKGNKSDRESRNFSNYYLALSYFRIPIFRGALLAAVVRDMKLGDKTMVKYSLYKKLKEKICFNLTIDEVIELDPINNLLLWDNLFYVKLYSSLDRCNSEQVKECKNYINDVKVAMTQNKVYKNYHYSNSMDWRTVISSKNCVFFEYMKKLILYVDRKVDVTGDEDINWNNIPGFDLLIEAIHYVLVTKEVKNYPYELIEIIPLLSSDIKLVNSLLNIIIHKINIYDTKSIFRYIDLIDAIINNDNLMNDPNSNVQRENVISKFDYLNLKESFFIIINTDNSLGIAKYIWLYYKNANLFLTVHLEEIISYIIIPYFNALFFHWSYQIRDIFFSFILYVLEFKFNARENLQKYKNTSNGNKKGFKLSVNSGYNEGIVGCTLSSSQTKYRYDELHKGIRKKTFASRGINEALMYVNPNPNPRNHNFNDFELIFNEYKPPKKLKIGKYNKKRSKSLDNIFKKKGKFYMKHGMILYNKKMRNSIYNYSTHNTNFKGNYKEYMNVIDKLIEIINDENNCITDSHDIINCPEYSEIIANIPEEFRANIYISIKHFIDEENDFIIWVNEICQKDNEIQYYMKFPIKEISLPRDDVLNYSNDTYN